MNKEKYPILSRIDSPEDVKVLTSEECRALAQETREFLIENVMKTGGHLASNLGVVELSIALHRVFNSPDDRIIWDVGHQSYVHKILTGRKERFDTLRTPGGLSGFTKRTESPHDPYGAGHSSTAMSAALGFAYSDAISKRGNYTVAVVGDGAFTGGLVHEALNNMRKNLRLIVIINENEMSISKNIGRFSRHIAKMRSTRGYLKTKSFTRKVVSRIPLVGKPLFRLIRSIKKALKNSLYGSNYFEDIGLYYLGPVDGNDEEAVEILLREAMSSKQSCIVHVKTIKGKGFAPAESDPAGYHSVAPGQDPDCLDSHDGQSNFSARFGELLCRMANSDERICAVTAAMTDGCGLKNFAHLYPERFFDVGIAEEHALIFAAGLAAGGMKPFVSIYSSFLQRGYDSILHDIALQKIPVTVCVDRASLSEKDGPTHHGIFDVSFLYGIPGTEIYAPCDFESLEKFMDLSLSAAGPVFIRYPNSGPFSSACECLVYKEPYLRSSFAPGERLDGIIITYGKIVEKAIEASFALSDRGFDCGVVMLEKLKPLQIDAVMKYIPDEKIPVLFLEEGIKSGGCGMNFYEKVKKFSTMLERDFEILAIDDNFAEAFSAGTDIYSSAGIGAEDICNFMTGHRATAKDCPECADIDNK